MKWTALIFALLAYVALGGGGSAYRWMRLRYPAANEDEVQCGGHKEIDGVYQDATPNKIRNCYYTDCFNKNKYLDSYFPHGAKKTRRRLEEEYKVPFQPNCNGENFVTDKDESTYQMVRTQAEQDRVNAAANNINITYTAPAAKDLTWDNVVPQYTFWDTSASPLAVQQKCTKGWRTAQRSGETRYEVKAPMKSKDREDFNCMYEQPPEQCQCRSIFCIVEQQEEKNGNDKKDQELTKNACNFLVRIEAGKWAPSLAKYTMWIIFGFSALTGLIVTGYFYNKYGDELVKGDAPHGGHGGEGGHGGHGN